MTYLKFREALSEFSVFSIRDILKIFPDFDSRRLVEWQQKKYISKLVNKWYLFTDRAIDELLLFRISNCIYRPSYVSLESALSYYHLIPEAVYSHQAVTTRKTISYKTSSGTFNYRTIKPKLFFGYEILHKAKFPVMVAEVEKAILDYLYLNSSLRTIKDMESLRLNYSEIKNSVDWKKLDKYAGVFQSKTLDKRIKYLKKLLPHVNAD